jgi:hypothetical protein
MLSVYTGNMDDRDRPTPSRARDTLPDGPLGKRKSSDRRPASDEPMVLSHLCATCGDPAPPDARQFGWTLVKSSDGRTASWVCPDCQ